MSLRILLIEDDPTIARLVRYCLEGQGHQVTVAGDGLAGLSTALAEPPDLVLLDLFLPNLGGHLVSQALRDDQRTQGIPVVLLTGAGKDESEEARACRPDGYLQKPFTPAQLLETVTRFQSDPLTHKEDEA